MEDPKQTLEGMERSDMVTLGTGEGPGSGWQVLYH